MKLILAYTYYKDGMDAIGRYFLDTDFALTDAAITEANIERWEEVIAHMQDKDPGSVTIIAVTVMDER